MDEQTPVYSIAVPTDLLMDVGVSSTAKLLYGVIESFQRASGVCFASNERLAREMGGCTERTISKCVNNLKTSGYIIVDDTKGRRIFLATSFPDGQEGGRKFPPFTKKDSREVEEKFQGGGRKIPPSISDSNTESKTKKKTIDPLPAFVDWIQKMFGSDHEPDEMNSLYRELAEYAAMRAESKSPLNTWRKVNGLLENLVDGSGGSLDVMCEMLKTARRRCWLSVYPSNTPPQPAERDDREWL